MSQQSHGSVHAQPHCRQARAARAWRGLGARDEPQTLCCRAALSTPSRTATKHELPTLCCRAAHVQAESHGHPEGWAPLLTPSRAAAKHASPALCCCSLVNCIPPFSWGMASWHKGPSLELTTAHPRSRPAARPPRTSHQLRSPAVAQPRSRPVARLPQHGEHARLGGTFRRRRRPHVRPPHLRRHSNV